MLHIQKISFAMAASTPSLDLALPLAWVVGSLETFLLPCTPECLPRHASPPEHVFGRLPSLLHQLFGEVTRQLCCTWMVKQVSHSGRAS